MKKVEQCYVQILDRGSVFTVGLLISVPGNIEVRFRRPGRDVITTWVQLGRDHTDSYECNLTSFNWSDWIAPFLHSRTQKTSSPKSPRLNRAESCSPWLAGSQRYKSSRYYNLEVRPCRVNIPMQGPRTATSATFDCSSAMICFQRNAAQNTPLPLQHSRTSSESQGLALSDF